MYECMDQLVSLSLLFFSCFFFLIRGFFESLDPVLEVAIIDQAGLYMAGIQMLVLIS